MLRTNTKKATKKSTAPIKAKKSTVAKKAKKVVAVSKRTACHNSHSAVEPRKAGVRLGQSALSAKFPDVTGNVVLPGSLDIKPFSTKENLSEGYVVLFSYPLDFTFVCPTELNEMSDNMDTFNKMGVKVYGVSTDSAQAHQAWMRMPVKQGGVEGLKFPLVSDTSLDISFAMGALLPPGIATRSTYILHNGNIKHASFNETGIGRSTADIIRTVEAIQFNAEHGEVCAASFSSKNKKSMKPTRDGLLEFLDKETV